MYSDNYDSKPVSSSTILRQDDSTFTFTVDDVEVSKFEPKLLSAKDLFNEDVEADAHFEDFSHRQYHEVTFIKSYEQVPGLISALHFAYDYHYPLKLSVSDFIILIGQGLGRHIEKNAEALRKHFVDHEDKKQISIERNEFLKGQQNDWSTVFEEFADKIKERVKTDIYEIVIDDTSVATKTSRIVSEIALMDAMKNYFTYDCSTSCGIPNITLEGRPEDWEKLQRKVEKLQELNKDDCLKLRWWLDALIPIVRQICETGTHRKPDAKFWNDIYKHRDRGSGTPHITGWITAFLPYLFRGRQNSFSRFHIDTHDIPRQISKVAFTWTYFGEKIPMNFYGGFLGAHFDKDTHTVTPVQFWSVNYIEPKSNQKECNVI